jgi:tetratricopeptide (TPR) repeat protein
MQALILRALDEAQPGLAIQAALSLAEFTRFTVSLDLEAPLCLRRRSALAGSDHQGARQRFEEALPLYQRVGAILGQANCIYFLGHIALRHSDHEAARQHYEEALTLYQRIDAIVGQANCIRSLGDTALRRSDHEGAQQSYEEALPLYQRVGDTLGQANCILGLGDTEAPASATRRR